MGHCNTPDFNSTPLSLDDIFAEADIAAIGDVPPRDDEQEYHFETDDRDRTEITAEGNRLTIRTRGDLRRIRPLASGGKRVSVDDIRVMADRVDLPRAFRPDWLARTVRPRILPRTYDLRFPNLDPDTYVVTNEWPWTCVGKLYICRKGSRSCGAGSGVMVGPRHMLTASHAMPWGTDDSTITFRPSYHEGIDPRFGEAHVLHWIGVQFEGDGARGNDFVICELDWRIGERTGWMGSQWQEDNRWYFAHPWTSIGYPASIGGEYPAFRMPVNIREVIDENSEIQRIITDSFATPGWSGGPLWGYPGGDYNDPKVIGVASGANPDFSLFASGRLMIDLVKAGYANWP